MISWNAENISNNHITLNHFAHKVSAQLIFLSEPQIYQCDLSPILEHFSESYEAHLNSEDVHDPDLPLTHSKAKGGTMVMWHRALSPYIKVMETSSPSFVSVLLSPPGYLPSLHTGVYLPTAGDDGKWLETLIDLESHITEIIEKHDGPIATFVRGDFNASSKNKNRSSLLSAVLSRLDLSRVHINSPTYHHFTGKNGEYDSDLDLLLFGGHDDACEVLVDTISKLRYPLLFSHHDIIISECSIPSQKTVANDTSNHVTAPRVENNRFATKWTDEGIAERWSWPGPAPRRGTVRCLGVVLR